MASSKEFVGIAEGIKSRELSLSSSLERLRSTLSSLRSERVQLEHQIMSLQAEIAAAENEDEPDEGLIAALELQLEQAYTDLGNTEQEIVETESEVEETSIEYERVEEEKRQTLFEIQQRARTVAQSINAASGMFGAYATVGASLSQSFQSAFDALSNAANILGGDVGSASGGGSGVGGKVSGHGGRGASAKMGTAGPAAAIAGSNAIQSSTPSHKAVSSKQISGAHSGNGRFTKVHNGSHSGKRNDSHSKQTSAHHTDNGTLDDLSYIRNIRSGKKMATQQASISKTENTPYSIANTVPGKNTNRERFLASLRVETSALSSGGTVKPSSSGAPNIDQLQRKQHREIEISDLILGATVFSIARNSGESNATEDEPQFGSFIQQSRNQILNTSVTREMEKNKDEEMQREAFQHLWHHYKSDKWRKASLEQRKQILNLFLGELNVLFGTNVSQKIEFKDFDDVKTANGMVGRIRGQYSSKNNAIYINNYFLTAKNSYQLMLTLIHEMRHAYQYYAVKNPEKVCVTEETIKHWKECFDESGKYKELKEREEGYLRISIEYDAKNFAGQRSDLHGMRYPPDYSGSWDKKIKREKSSRTFGILDNTRHLTQAGVSEFYSDIINVENSATQRQLFQKQLSQEAPSMKEQAERAKSLPNAEQYLHDRNESENVEKDYPNRKSWELTPTQLERIQEAQRKVAETNWPIVKPIHDNDAEEQKTPGGDAWEKRFRRIEGEK